MSVPLYLNNLHIIFAWSLPSWLLTMTKYEVMHLNTGHWTILFLGISSLNGKVSQLSPEMKAWCVVVTSDDDGMVSARLPAQSQLLHNTLITTAQCAQADRALATSWLPAHSFVNRPGNSQHLLRQVRHWELCQHRDIIILVTRVAASSHRDE